jgi:large subunit ribosomal protein L21
VAGAKVELEVTEHLRAKKIVVFKMKRRKRYRVKQGHRQELTRVTVKDISVD